MRKTNDLGRDPVFRLVCRLAIPTMLAQLVSVLYSIVDRIYIGNIQGIGDLVVYEKIARRRNISYLPASEFARPGEADQEHLDELGQDRKSVV